MKTKTVQELITPEKAEQYLKKNKRNRPINLTTVELYANDIRNGNWLFNHQGIAFNEKGELIDGQHRLEAIRMAKIPIMINVTTGLSDEKRNGVIVNVMDTVDRGRVRTIGQQLGLFHGITNGNRVAAVCVAICRFFSSTHTNKLTTSQVLHVVKIYGSDFDAVYSLTDANKKLPAYLSAPIVILHNSDPATAMDFVTKLITLEGLTAQSPVKALLRWLDHHPNANSMKDTTMKVVASCLRHFKDKNSISKVYANEDAYHWLISTQKANERKIREILNIK